jgi:glycosyltransferase involved in cell wall biosynthesis
VDPHLSGHAVPVTVIVPCFRCEATIGRALDSVRRQTRAPAEVLVVDDASDDCSADKLAELTSVLPRLRTVRLASNQGPASARNAAWRAVTQPYIAFLDADDAWHPQKLELQYEWMQSHPECVLTGHAIVDAGKLWETDRPILRAAVAVSSAQLLVSNRFQTTSVMLRANVPQRFADGKRFCEDYLLWLEIVLAGGNTYYLDIPLAVRFKAVYGKQGASARLWDMERGELDALSRLRRAGLLGPAGYGAAAAWSLVKYVRRALLPIGGQ